MAFFTSSDQFYLLTRALFERLRDDNLEATQELNKAKLLIRFNCREPEAVITINGRHVPTEVTYGLNKVRPEVDVRLAGDTFHRILLGDLRLGKALASRDVEVRGPAHKALAVAALFRECQSIYPQILLEHGLHG